MKGRDLLLRLRRGEQANVAFGDFLRLVNEFGFRLERTTGSHRTLRHRAYPIRLNLQPVGGEAKPYQIRQFLRLVELYGLEWEESED